MDLQYAVLWLYSIYPNLMISANPLISVIVDNDWRKDSLRDLDIFIPSHAKTQAEEGPENLNKLLPPEKTKEWTDIGINRKIYQQ
jgi:hypothetical protein